MLQEEAQTEALRSELTTIRGEIRVEKDRLLSEDEQLKEAYTALTQAEEELHKQHDKVDLLKNAEWKRILDGLSEENYHIEEAWQDLTEQETIVNQKLASGNFSSDEERMDCENDREQLLHARALLKEEEERIAATQQKEMERVENEMERWTQQKENELKAVEKKRDDLLRQQSKPMNSLFVQVESKLSEINTQQEKCHSLDQLLKSLDDDVQKQICDLKQEQQVLLDLKEKKSQEQKTAEEEKKKREADIKRSLKDLQESANKEVQKIEEERQRWVQQMWRFTVSHFGRVHLPGKSAHQPPGNHTMKPFH